jgi:CubicO group peptidase (beta-lactamase class C family)
MKKIIALLLVFAVFTCATAQDSTAQKIDELMSAYAHINRFNGSVLIAQQGHILLNKGYGFKNAENKSLNDSETVFQIASITKQFTATVVLKLIEMNKLSLNDKLSKYYKGFPYGDSITIKELLYHTSGLRNFTEEDTAINETNEEKMVSYLKTLKPDFAPGTNWHYSNSGYVVLGYIIQKVSGMSYWAAVRKYIFEPLQMNNSGFDFAHLNSNEKAVGYDVLNDSVQQPSAITDSTVPFAAGAIYSTVTDMYKWYNGLRENKIINANSFTKAITASALHNYGFGWQIDSVYGKEIISHSGAITGFGSNFACNIPDDICIVLLSNKSGSTFDVMHITNKLLAVLYHQPYSIPKKRIPVAVDEKILEKYTGTYTIDEINLTIDVSVNNGTFVAQPARDGHPGPTSVLLGIDNTHFYDTHDEELEVSMDIGNDGKVNGIRILQNGITKYAKKIK